MSQEETYRAYLLGSADSETEAEVEEGLLDGRIEAARLQQIEDELIDDLLFGRLSTVEEGLFRSGFLCSPARTARLEFARALQAYAVRSATPVIRPGLFTKLRASVAMPWVLPLAGALGCAVLTGMWFSERTRNLNLNHELALATHTNDAQQRTIASILDEQRRSAAQPAALTPPPAPIPSPEHAVAEPVFHLSPGVSRGVTAVNVLPLSRHAATATLVLAIPFDPAGTLREELQNASDQTIWKQEFAVTTDIATHKITTIVLPAELLSTGEYRLRISADRHGEEHEGAAGYLFRVRRD